MSGGSDSASEIWKPWPGWKSEPAACVLGTAFGSPPAAEANLSGFAPHRLAGRSLKQMPSPNTGIAASRIQAISGISGKQPR